jgi:hypothetical protein
MAKNDSQLEMRTHVDKPGKAVVLAVMDNDINAGIPSCPS